jgi:hypothetical protein
MRLALELSSSQIISAVGLVFDIIGIIILFYFGPPVLRITREGHQILPYNAMDEVVTKKNQAIYRKHDRMSKIGLVLVFLGFVLQLLGTLWR